MTTFNFRLSGGRPAAVAFVMLAVAVVGLCLQPTRGPSKHQGIGVAAASEMSDSSGEGNERDKIKADALANSYEALRDWKGAYREAACYLESRREHDAAVELFDEALHKYGSDNDYALDVMQRRAWLLIRANRYAPALDALADLRKRFAGINARMPRGLPAGTPYWYYAKFCEISGRAQVFEAQGKFADALREYEGIVQLVSDDRLRSLDLGGEVLAQWATCGHVETPLRMGNCYAAMGQWDRARSECLAAKREIETSDRFAKYSRGAQDKARLAKGVADGLKALDALRPQDDAK